MVVRVFRRFILERHRGGAFSHLTPGKGSQFETLHGHFFVGVVESGLVTLWEQAVPLFVAAEAQSGHSLDVCQVLGGLFDGLKTAIIDLSERVDLFALDLSIEVTDLVLLLGNQLSRLVLLDVEFCRAFVIDQVIVVHCHDCVVAR